jgi:hypothetical protein
LYKLQIRFNIYVGVGSRTIINNREMGSGRSENIFFIALYG